MIKDHSSVLHNLEQFVQFKKREKHPWSPLNLPEDNMNSIAELIMNALKLELRLG